MKTSDYLKDHNVRETILRGIKDNKVVKYKSFLLIQANIEIVENALKNIETLLKEFTPEERYLIDKIISENLSQNEVLNEITKKRLCI